MHGRRTSTESLLTLDGIVARKVVEGSVTKEIFLEYLEHNVVSPSTISRCYFELLTGRPNTAP